MTPASSSSSSRPGGCAGDGCFAGDAWPLHYARGAAPSSFRRLCTSCVLRSHLGLFCSHCFRLLESPDQSPPSPEFSVTVKCRRCPSVAHRRCLAESNPEGDGFLCPSCSAPQGFSYFPLSKDTGEGSRRVVDETTARVLLAAARLASGSMSRAAAAARADADRKVREAAVARKRARESLDNAYSASVNGDADLMKKVPKDGNLTGREDKDTGNKVARFNNSPVMQRQGNPVVAAAAALGVVLPSSDARLGLKSAEKNTAAVAHGGVLPGSTARPGHKIAENNTAGAPLGAVLPSNDSRPGFKSPEKNTPAVALGVVLPSNATRSVLKSAEKSTAAAALSVVRPSSDTRPGFKIAGNNTAAAGLGVVHPSNDSRSGLKSAEKNTGTIERVQLPSSISDVKLLADSSLDGQRKGAPTPIVIDSDTVAMVPNPHPMQGAPVLAEDSRAVNSSGQAKEALKP